MARSLKEGIVAALFVAALAANLSIAAKPAIAAEMDKNAKADAKTAMRFYKEGNYEDAAKIFLKLSIAHPDMLVFVRNLGACYYYMRRYEPALSNLRDYEHRKKDMAPDDRAEVEGWIGEMERLRDQTMATATAPPPAALPAPMTAAAAPPIVASLPAATLTTPPAVAGVPAAGPVGPVTAPGAPGLVAVSPQTAVTPSPSPATPASIARENVYPQQQSMGVQPAYGQQGQFGAPPAYPQSQYGAPSPYGQGPYAPQPVSPNMQYPPAGGGYPPTYQPAAYPPSGPPAGVAATASQPKSSGGARKAVAWILGIAGLGSAGVGGYFVYKAVSDFSKVEKKYDPSVEKEGKTDRTAAAILCGAGAAALTVAIIVGASGGSSSSAVALAPVVGPGTAGASLSGSF